MVPPQLEFERDLGTSARSLMKAIGMDWFAHVPDIEKSLFENYASHLAALPLTMRALIGPHLSTTLRVDVGTLDKFSIAVAKHCAPNPFHNAYHAAQCMHHVAILLEYVGLTKRMAALDYVAVLLAAGCVDAGHLGRTNAFLVDTGHDLAIRYNDHAVLENHRASVVFGIIRNSEGCNIFANLGRREARRVRAIMIQLTLGMDSALHFQQVSELRSRVAEGTILNEPSMEDLDQKTVLACIMRAAEMGFHAMKWDVHVLWANRLAEEFAQQGDNERVMDIPVSPMCDRLGQELSAMQASLVNLLALPLFEELMRLVDLRNPAYSSQFGAILAALVTNHTAWVHLCRRSSRDDFCISSMHGTMAQLAGSGAQVSGSGAQVAGSGAVLAAHSSSGDRPGSPLSPNHVTSDLRLPSTVVEEPPYMGTSPKSQVSPNQPMPAFGASGQLSRSSSSASEDHESQVGSEVFVPVPHASRGQSIGAHFRQSSGSSPDLLKLALSSEVNSGLGSPASFASFRNDQETGKLKDGKAEALRETSGRSVPPSKPVLPSKPVALSHLQVDPLEPLTRLTPVGATTSQSYFRSPLVAASSSLAGGMLVQPKSPKGMASMFRTPTVHGKKNREADEPASLTYSQAHGPEAFGEIVL